MNVIETKGKFMEAASGNAEPEFTFKMGVNLAGLKTYVRLFFPLTRFQDTRI